MGPIDQDQHLIRRICFGFGIRTRYRLPLKIGRDAMRSIPHGRVAHRIARQ
jgi:hypothetical protein